VLRIFIFWILIPGFDSLSDCCGLVSFGFIDSSKEKKDLEQKIVQLEYFPVDIGQENTDPMIQQKAVKRTFNFLHGKI